MRDKDSFKNSRQLYVHNLLGMPKNSIKPNFYKYVNKIRLLDFKFMIKLFEQHKNGFETRTINNIAVVPKAIKPTKKPFHEKKGKNCIETAVIHQLTVYTPFYF